MFCLIWLLWVYDTPAKAKKISTSEINFIRGGGPKSDGKINPKVNVYPIRGQAGGTGTQNKKWSLHT